jgi:hypothetical protein
VGNELELRETASRDRLSISGRRILQRPDTSQWIEQTRQLDQAKVNATKVGKDYMEKLKKVSSIPNFERTSTEVSAKLIKKPLVKLAREHTYGDGEMAGLMNTRFALKRSGRLQRT